MVGVAGKFKGCNTCRARRVKCDNDRPHCRKCIDSGRECGGYDRERVFIVGTAKERGRCSSHPHRSLLSAKSTKSKSRGVSIKLESVKLIDQNVTKTVGVRCLAAQTRFDLLERQYGGSKERGEVVAVPPSALTEGTTRSPLLMGLASPDTEFEMRCVCLGYDGEPLADGEELNFNTPLSYDLRKGSLVFLYEVGDSMSQRSSPSIKRESEQGSPDVIQKSFAKILGGNASQIQRQGPQDFSTPIAQHFFAQIYRPFSTFYALTHRQPTFLADNEWCTLPWSATPKNDLDRLFDILVPIPDLFARGEELELQTSSLDRRLSAGRLLRRCTSIDAQLERWLVKLLMTSDNSSTVEQDAERIVDNSNKLQPSLWIADTYFKSRNAKAHEALIYYWAASSTFYRAIQHIHAIYAADIPVSLSPTIEAQDNNVYGASTPVSTAATGTTNVFTPPLQAQELSMYFGAGWSPSSLAPETVSTPILAHDTNNLAYDNYLPDPFVSQVSFAPDLPAEFGYMNHNHVPSGQFANSTEAAEPLIAGVHHQAEIYGQDAFDPYNANSTFLIPATPITATSTSVCLPTSATFPLPPHLPTSMPYNTQAYSPDPLSHLLNTHTAPPSSRNNSAASLGRLPSMTHSYPHSRSPTPNSFSPVPLSSHSVRISTSNPTSNPTNSASNLGVSIGYGSTPPPPPASVQSPVGYSNTPSPTLNNVHPMKEHNPALSVVLDLASRYNENNVLLMAQNVMRGAQLFLEEAIKLEPTGEANSTKDSSWQGGPVLAITLREAMKVFRRQGHFNELELCQKLLVCGCGTRITAEITSGVWRE